LQIIALFFALIYASSDHEDENRSTALRFLASQTSVEDMSIEREKETIDKRSKKEIPYLQ
jgi:hypothetical protein